MHLQTGSTQRLKWQFDELAPGKELFINEAFGDYQQQARLLVPDFERTAPVFVLGARAPTLPGSIRYSIACKLQVLVHLLATCQATASPASRVQYRLHWLRTLMKHGVSTRISHSDAER